MKQTKLIAAALISALVLTVSAGCSNNNQPADTTSPDAAVTETDTKAADTNTDSPETSADTEAATEAVVGDLWANALYTEDAEVGEGAAAIQVEVKAGDKSVTITVHTDKDNLGAALVDNKLVEGDQSEYGLYIKTVNGIKADFDTDGAWWGIFKDGEMTLTGADATMIADGEHYELVYSK